MKRNRKQFSFPKPTGYFPLLIEYLNGSKETREVRLVYTPKDILLGIPFRVIKTNAEEGSVKGLILENP